MSISAPTAGDIVTRALTLIHGGGASQDRVTPLAAGIGATDSALQVVSTFGPAVGLTPGLCEIDSELVYLTSADATTGNCTIAPGFGRGYLGSTAASHAAGARVISRPKFPRIEILNAVNDTIGGLYPDLFAVGTTALTTAFNAPVALPTTARTILAIDYQDWATGDWLPLTSYRINRYDGGISIDALPAGYSVRVSYAYEPSRFTSETDDFATVTQLPPTCVDLLVWGAVIKTVPGLDISRAQTSTVEQSSRSQVVPPNAGLTASKYLYGLYTDRLNNEKRALRSQYPTRIVRNV